MTEPIYADLTFKDALRKESKPLLVRAVVDTSVANVMITSEVAQALGIDLQDSRITRTRLPETGDIPTPMVPVTISWKDRDYSIGALVLGTECRTGFILLDALGLAVDPIQQCLIPNPAHPEGPLINIRINGILHRGVVTKG